MLQWCLTAICSSLTRCSAWISTPLVASITGLVLVQSGCGHPASRCWSRWDSGGCLGTQYIVARPHTQKGCFLWSALRGSLPSIDRSPRASFPQALGTASDLWWHYNDVIMGAIASQITSLTVVYSTVCSNPDQRKHQSSASLAFVPGIHRWPVNSPHKWPVMRKMFSYDDVIMGQLKHWTLVRISHINNDCTVAISKHYQYAKR